MVTSTYLCFCVLNLKFNLGYCVSELSLFLFDDNKGIPKKEEIVLL